jgi:hypothetical protein
MVTAHLFASKYHTALLKMPAATRYKKQLEMIRKICIVVALPPLCVIISMGCQEVLPEITPSSPV